MPRWNQDNLMTHVFAAALIVDGFEVDVNDLREDLKLDNRACVSRSPPPRVTVTNRPLQDPRTLPGARVQGCGTQGSGPCEAEDHKGGEQQPLLSQAKTAVAIPPGEDHECEEAVAAFVVSGRATVFQVMSHNGRLLDTDEETQEISLERHAVPLGSEDVIERAKSRLRSPSPKSRTSSATSPTHPTTNPLSASAQSFGTLVCRRSD